ncbi:MAG TPA: hypothetical protein VMF69_00845 [Gemmataceae bacterium]|nr:hypothetical protein [Gemmataceae bacterium]
MSLKEFDAKQFLLEKGERVGLGVAVTLMVLMLIFSLFMPSKGFFSGSPAAKAKELNQSTDRLDNDLRTSQPRDSDLPEKREGKLIALDTQILDADKYASNSNWFEPRMQEDKSRRPPDIYNVAEAVAEVAAVPIDTYLFRFNPDNVRILVLEDKNRRNAPPGGLGGMRNPFGGLKPGGMPGGMGGGMAGRSGGGGMPPGMGRNPFGGTTLPGAGSLLGVGGAAAKPEYETNWISVEDWNSQQPAHQLQPLRMAIIAGSFPYKQQLEEHKTKLRHKSLAEVLNEPLGKGENQTGAFDFRGMEVERMEVDAEGNKVSDWAKLPLLESFNVWLKNSYYPLEEENPKYALVRPNDGIGLLMPLLREFHASKINAPGFLGMMPGMGALSGAQQRREEPPAEENKSKYPDIAAKLPKIQETLDKLRDAQPKQIAASKFRKAEFLNPFNPNATLPSDKAQNPTLTNIQGGTSTEQSVYPDYVLVRAVDVTIKPGKHYRYRLKMKMANPNYQRSDVASPEYKEKEILESKDWYELPQTVTVPQELFYYVVDEAQGMDRNEITAIRRTIPESAQYRMLTLRRPSEDQVVMQFQRWVEATRISRKETDAIPVGEWAVAERVYVARGEYVGRPVNIDLPIWKYNQNTFILPAEEQKPKARAGGKVPSGIDVDFGQEAPENNLILVDFEGGRVSIQTPKVDDTCAIEVLMLAPDGKLLARNSIKDSSDQDRIDRRKKVLERIQNVREGKETD